MLHNHKSQHGYTRTRNVNANTQETCVNIKHLANIFAWKVTVPPVHKSTLYRVCSKQSCPKSRQALTVAKMANSAWLAAAAAA
jgi:hypothetical protein